MQLNTNTYSDQSHSESVDLTARNFHTCYYFITYLIPGMKFCHAIFI